MRLNFLSLIAFLQRTFNSRGRLGKVAYRFA